MEFLGSDGWPSPRLRDVEVGESKARELYWDLCLDVRRIYHDCKLVHGDLSEFNILYHKWVESLALLFRMHVSPTFYV